MEKAGFLLLKILVLLWSADFTCSSDAKKICFAKYGCFSIDKDIKVNYAALPSHPSVIQTKFFLHTRKSPKNADELNLKNISSIMASNFDPSRRTIFIVHGFAHHSQKPWVIKMKNELLKRCWYNVISVDWRKGASYLTMSYLKAAANSRLVGAQIAHLLEVLYDVKGISTKSVHIIGHSLGAHIAGYAGKRLSRKNFTLGRISGLDPARPQFEGNHADARLDKTDANFVDVIHTNSAPFLFGGAGYRGQLGHVDFYPNGGEYQPGCEGLLRTIWQSGVLNAATCHHMRSVEYFTASIQQQCLFLAFPCSSWEDFKGGKCLKNFRVKQISVMGMQAQRCKKYEQPLYLTTLSNSPFCVYNYVILLSYSRSETKYNSVYLQLFGSDNTSKKKKIQLDRGSGSKIELLTHDEDIGELISVKLFYYGFSSFYIHHVRVNIIHRNKIYFSCFDQLVKNSFWLFWRVSEATYSRQAHVGENCKTSKARSMVDSVII